MINFDLVKQQFEADLTAAKSPEDLQNLRIKYFGRKQGIITEAFKELAALTTEEKQKFGPLLNQLRQEAESRISSAEQNLSGDQVQIDFTVPPLPLTIGHLHPLTQTQNELEDIFKSLGFAIEHGFEMESDWYNFVALNFPEDHPARDMQDTFYLAGQEQKPAKEKVLLRTHTSPMQVRFMETHKPPFAVIVPGTVYRNEATDSTHEHTFKQLEGLMVGENISFANMVWVLNRTMKLFFGDEVKTKYLPTYFPFVEPGAEVAISSPKFQNGRWIELFGCGMVHQNVFKAAGYPANKYQGFAFGFGMSRFALMKYGIPDIRLLSENNLQFLNQF